MVGSLPYAAPVTRPEFAHVEGAVSKFNPTETHLTAVKKILCNLKGTINLGLMHKKTSDSSLCAVATPQPATLLEFLVQLSAHSLG